MRLIDIDEFDYENIMCSQDQLHWLNRQVEKQPVVDAVPVVRCKDCKYRVLDTVSGEDWCNHTLGLCSEVYATDFCCHGERKYND